MKNAHSMGTFFIAENVLKTFHKIQFSLVFTFLSKIYEKPWQILLEIRKNSSFFS